MTSPTNLHDDHAAVTPGLGSVPGPNMQKPKQDEVLEREIWEKEGTTALERWVLLPRP